MSGVIATSHLFIALKALWGQIEGLLTYDSGYRDRNPILLGYGLAARPRSYRLQR